MRFVVVSTEHDFGQNSPQMLWLATTLAAVDRDETPWVVVYGHRPTYCSGIYLNQCGEGGPDHYMAATLRRRMEPLFVKAKVVSVRRSSHQCLLRSQSFAVAVGKTVAATAAIATAAAALACQFHYHHQDLVLWGHEHAYERVHPVINGTVVGRTTEAPKAPINLVLGMGGAGNS